MAKEAKQGDSESLLSESLIQIPAKALSEAFVCPICLGELVVAHITECGHNFCEHCIRECLNRKHSCPLCQRETTADKLIKNHAFDSLLRQIKDEKERASRNYINQLMQQAKNASSEEQSVAKSPIEDLFQKHTRRFLLAYGDYHRELQSSFDKQRLILRAEYMDKLSQIDAIKHLLSTQRPEEAPDEPEGPEASPVLIIDKFSLPSLPLARTPSTEQAVLAGEALIRAFNERVAEMTARFNASVAALTSSYDTYMESLAPPMFLIPVKCALVFPALAMKFDVSLRPTNRIADVITFLEERQRRENNPVSASKNLKFFLRRPFSSAPGSVSASSAGDGGQNRQGLQEVGGEMTIAELHLEQESEIVVEGEILLKSSEPLQCFSVTYVKGEDKKIDYFRCQDCALNWICKPCSVSCHMNHKLVPFMMDHKPTYGCCYCSRNKKCSLQNKKSKKDDAKS